MTTSRSGVGCDPRPVDRDARDPLWRQVHDDLLRRVEAGAFTDAFPGELALTVEYGVSRQTIREALRRLRAAGVVRAERGRVSRLADPVEISQPVGALYSMFASVQAAGQEQRSDVRCLDVRRHHEAAERLGLPAEARLVYLERIRYAGDRPLATDRVWLPADVAEPLLAADFTRTALYAELEQRCGIRLTGGAETIRAVVPTSAERSLLGIPTGVAAFAIERLTHVGSRPVEWRHTLIRADRFALNAAFSGDEGFRFTDAAQALP